MCPEAPSYLFIIWDCVQRTSTRRGEGGFWKNGRMDVHFSEPSKIYLKLNPHCQDVIMKSYVLCVPGNLNLLFCPIMMSICIMILNPSHQFLDAVWTRYWFLETWFKPEKCTGQFLDSSYPDRNRPEMYWKGSRNDADVQACRYRYRNESRILIQIWCQFFGTFEFPGTYKT